MFSEMELVYSERLGRVATAAAYDTLMCHFSGLWPRQRIVEFIICFVWVRRAELFNHQFSVRSKLNMLLTLALFDGGGELVYVFILAVSRWIIRVVKFFSHPSFDTIQNSHAEVVIGF
jgi:hypothetical protein